MILQIRVKCNEMLLCPETAVVTAEWHLSASKSGSVDGYTKNQLLLVCFSLLLEQKVGVHIV